jgi:ABC-type hemin transport system substrate-binding protein
VLDHSAKSALRIKLPYYVEMNQPHWPRRIVCLEPSATVVLASVGALDRVVARTRYCAEVVPSFGIANH